MMRLNVKAFAFTCALVWGFGLLLMTWWIILMDGSTGELTFIGRLYRGYDLSFVGSIIGFVWAIVDGLIGGAVFAWVYNVLARRASSGAAA